MPMLPQAAALLACLLLLLTTADAHGTGSSSDWPRRNYTTEPGREGIDYRYYTDSHPFVRVSEADGVRVRSWVGDGSLDLSQGSPTLTRVDFSDGSAGASFPPAPPQQASASFWLPFDAFFVTVVGKVRFELADASATGVIHEAGDVFWLAAGTAMKQIVHADGKPAVVQISTPRWDVRWGAAGVVWSPSLGNASSPRSRSYLGRDCSWAPNPSPHSDECMANGGVQNCMLGAGPDAVDGTPPVLRVRWAPNCSIPYHYHPTGAMYFVQYGEMFFKGDHPTKDLKIGPGDVRWVRPGFDYGPEFNGDAPMQITVFGTDAPPTFSAPPPGPYAVAKPTTLRRIFERPKARAAPDCGTSSREYAISILFKRNSPSSVKAKDKVQALLCARFGIQPCAPPAATRRTSTRQQGGAAALGLRIVRDLDLAVPSSNLTDVLTWLLQHRHATVNGAGSVDLRVATMPAPHTSVGCEKKKKLVSKKGQDEEAEAAVLFAGHRWPFNVNAAAERLPPAVTDDAAFKTSRSGMRSAVTEDNRGDEQGDNIWMSCSSDATCYEPYAHNTGCTGDAGVASFHFHYYYVATDPVVVTTDNKYIDEAQRQFNLDPDVCPDNHGHEQPHNVTCWLSGPGGSGPLPRPNNVSHQGPGGSFTIPVFSLYVTRPDFERVLAWTLDWQRTAAVPLDFLMHPNSGCSFADHVDFGLHGAKYIPANMQGVAEEAGWDNATGPAVDPWAAANPLNAPHPGCGLTGTSTRFERFALHVLYDASLSSDKAAAAAFLQGLQDVADAQGLGPTAVQVGKPRPRAWADPSSVALSSEQVIVLGSSKAAIELLLPWALLNHGDLDLLIAPLSSGGLPCRRGDYVSRAAFAGDAWPMNLDAVLHAASDCQLLAAAPPDCSKEGMDAHMMRRLRGHDRDRVSSTAPPPFAPPANYVLYFTAAQSNGFQMAAVGIPVPPRPHPPPSSSSLAAQPAATTTQAPTQPLLARFKAAYADVGPCATANVSAWLRGGEQAADAGIVCWLGDVVAKAFASNDEVMPVSYAALHVPQARMLEMLSWAMHNRVAARSGYNVGLRLVPMVMGAADGDEEEEEEASSSKRVVVDAFTMFALKAGSDWRLNLSPLRR